VSPKPLRAVILPLQALVLEQLVDREDRLRQLRVVRDAGHPGLPRERVLAVRVEAGVLLDGHEVRDVRDHVLVELLRPALLDHSERYCSLSVRTMMSLLIDWPRRERTLDLPEELGVRVDVLGVLDLDAGLLRERIERRKRLRLLVDVDVVRPVREAERVGELLGPPAAGTAAAAAPPQAAAKPGIEASAAPNAARFRSSSRDKR
jgi:hypothetical protein